MTSTAADRLNVLVVHEVDWLRKVVYELHDFSEHLAILGHRVIAVDFEEGWADGPPDARARFEGSLPNGSGVLRGSSVLREVSRATGGRGGVELHRPPLLRVPLLDRASAVLIHAATVPRILERERIDVVLLYSAPTNGLSTLLAARRRGIPVVFRAIDVLHRMRTPVALLGPPVLAAERLVLKLADRVVANSPRLRRYAQRLGRRRDCPDVVLPGVATDVFHPADPDPERARALGIELGRDRVVGFAGTFFDFAGLDVLIDGLCATEAAAGPGGPVKLLLIGGGEDEPAIRERVRARGVSDRVVFTGFRPYEEVGPLLALADVTVCGMRINEVTRDIVPAKVHQCMACGRPLVCSPMPGVMDVVPGEAAGVVYAPLEDFPAAIGGLLADRERRERLGAAAAEYISRHHDWAAQTRLLERILRDEAARAAARRRGRR